METIIMGYNPDVYFCFEYVLVLLLSPTLNPKMCVFQLLLLRLSVRLRLSV